MRNDIIKIVRGNFFRIAQPLSKITWETSTKTVEDYIPQEGDKLEVNLISRTRPPYSILNVAIDGNLLTYECNGNLECGIYSVEIKIKQTDGQRYRSFQADRIAIVFTNEEAGINVTDELDVTTYNIDPALLLYVKGEKGDPGQDGTMRFEDLTPAQRESLKGDKGDTGTGIASIEQTQTATESEGTNEITITMDDENHTEYTFEVKNGAQGVKGDDGKSAYEVYVDNVPKGEEPLSESDWLASLEGEKGDDGDAGKSAYQVYLDTVPEGETPMTESQWLASLKGEKGDKGVQGDTLVVDGQNTYKLYHELGQNNDGAVDQKVYSTEHAKVVDASIAPEAELKGLALQVTDGHCWTYENDTPVDATANNFKGAILDVSGLYEIELLFYLDATWGAKTFFADDNGVKIGDFLSNTTKTWQRYDVPYGATKLYFSTNTQQLSSYGARTYVHDTAMSLIAMLEDDMYQPVEIPSTSWIQGAFKGGIVGGKYDQMNSYDYPMFIPVEHAKKVTLTAGSKMIVGTFVTNSEMVDNANVPYAEGEANARVVAANQTVTLIVPSDAKYLFCEKYTDRLYPASVVGVFGLDYRTSKSLSEIEDEIDVERERIDDLSDAATETSNIPSSAWITGSFTGGIAGGKYNKYERNWDYPKLIPVGNANKVVIEAGAMMTVYTFVTNSEMSNGGDVPYAEGYTTQYVVQANQTETIDVPSDAEYMFCEQNNSNRVYPISVSRVDTAFTKMDNLKDEVMEDAKAVAGLTKQFIFNNDYKVVPYEGRSPYTNNVRFTKIGVNDFRCQSMAIYGGYLFTFQNGVEVNIFRFDGLKKIAHINAIESADDNHCNASYFSNEFVDPADEFPILYIEKIYDVQPILIGYRIQCTDHVNNVWTITKVHEIYYNIEPQANFCAYDRQNDDLIVIYGFNLEPNQHRCHRPTYADSTNGVSTITDGDLVAEIPFTPSDLKNGAYMELGQDKCVCGNTLVGLSVQKFSNTIFGLDAVTGKLTFALPLTPLGLGEAEGLEEYCGRFYVCALRGNGGDLYEIDFNDGVIAPTIAGTSRPQNPEEGRCFFDKNINKAIWYINGGWVDANGQSV